MPYGRSTSWSIIPPPSSLSIHIASFWLSYSLSIPSPLRSRSGNSWCVPSYFGAHVTVESTVIEVCQAVFEVGRLLAQPFGESTPDLVYLAVGELYGLPVTHFDLPPFAVHPFEDGLGDVGRSVLQGVFQKVQAVVLTGLRADGILAP